MYLKNRLLRIATEEMKSKAKGRKRNTATLAKLPVWTKHIMKEMRKEKKGEKKRKKKGQDREGSQPS